jgi:extracellular factor (EF) 3-hydroxypalmitic acid methyl ester biosynthesis protein
MNPIRPIRPIDPVIVFKNSQGETARGTLTNIQRRSLVMEVYNPYSIVQVSEVLSDLTIRAGAEQIIYQGKAFINGLVNTGLMAIVSVTLIDEWSEFHAIHRDLNLVKSEAESFVQEWDARFKINREYQIVINEMRSYFAEINRWIDQIDINSALPKDHLGRIREDVFFDIAVPLMEKGKSYLLNFEGQASLVEPELSASHRSYAQTAIHPLILRAPFVYRTFAKPLGYAGDYEMVNQIMSDPRQGPSSYFQLVNFMFLQAKVAEAHRNRIAILVERLTRAMQARSDTSNKFRILTIGCGPAFELERLLKENRHMDNVEIVLLDFSEETLQHTKAKLDGILSQNKLAVSVSTRHESVHVLLKRASKNQMMEESEKYDYIYCAGLFDYLSDKVCSRLIEYFTSCLKQNAKILVTNVHSSNPEKNWMEHFLEWHLIYRNEEDMRKILPLSYRGIDCFTDATGVNVFLESTYAL